MNLHELWQAVLFRFRPRTAAACGAELTDELMFHFRSLVIEKVDSGLPVAAAWNQAEEQFGPVRRYEERCREQLLADRILKERLAVGAVMAIAVVAAWGAFYRPSIGESSPLRAGVALLAPAGAVEAAADPASDSHDFTGTVQDSKGQPLADARLLVILKTWPNGRYQQADLSATSDKEGRFQFADLVPKNSQYAIHCTALKDGYAFRSNYQLDDKAPFSKPKNLTLKLDSAVDLNFVIQDAAGKPIAGASVAPRSRKHGKTEHLIYFQGSEDTWRTTDVEGRANLKCFQAGDKTTVAFRAAEGGEWTEQEIVVPAKDGSLTITLDRSE